MAEIDQIGGVKNLAVDRMTNDIVVLDHEHHEIHEGDHFTVTAYNADLDDTITMKYLLTTPAAPKQIHWVAYISATAKTLVQFYEDTTRTSTDTAITSYNNNRASTDTAELMIQTQSTTDGADGTLIDSSSFGSALGANITGGSDRNTREWLLDFSSYYFFKVTSGADNNNVSLRFEWYEHEAK